MKSKVQTVNRVNYEQVDTIVSSDIVFVGDITSGGSVRFEGNLKGNISINNQNYTEDRSSRIEISKYTMKINDIEIRFERSKS